MVDIPLGNIRVEIRAFDEPQEELVDDLEVRPGELQDRFVFFGVKCVAGRIYRRGYRTKKVGSELGRRFRLDGWGRS